MDDEAILENNGEENWLETWERRRRMAVVQVLCYVVYAIYWRRMYYCKRHVDQSIRQRSEEIEQIQELMYLFRTNEKCRDVTMESFDLNDSTSEHAISIEASPQAPSQSATSLEGKKRKASGDDICERVFESISKAIKNVAEAIREGNAIIKKGRARVYSEEEVFAELVNIGVDPPLRYRAYGYLIENVVRMRAFFGCPVEERKDFLQQMMYGFNDLR